MFQNLCFATAMAVGALLSGATSVATTIANQETGGSSTIDRLYRLDCGRSRANDESVWTPGENVGKTIEFSSTCYLILRGPDIIIWDTGVPDATIHDPAGWSTLPKLIVYHLDRTITSQLTQSD